MRNYNLLKTLLLLLYCSSVLMFFMPLQALSADEEKTPTTVTSQQALSLIEINTWSNTLPRDLIDLQNNIETIANIAKIEEKLPTLEELIEELDWDATMAKSNPELRFDDLTALEATLRKISAEINSINKPIEKNVKELEIWYREWVDKESKLKEFSQQAAEITHLSDSLPDISSLANLIVKAKELIAEQIRPNLLAGRKINDFETRVYAINDIIGDLIRERKALRTQQTAPSMLSADFYSTITVHRISEAWQNLRLFANYKAKQFIQQRYVIGLCFLGLLVVAICVYFSKTLVIASHKWYPFASRPVTTAIFILSATLSIIDILAIQAEFHQLWTILIQLPLVISVALLSDLIFKIKWQNALLKQLLVFLAVIIFFNAIDLPHPLYYLFIFYSSLFLFVYYLYFTMKRLLTSPGQKITWSIILWAVFPLSIVIAGIGGYDQLASTIFGRVLSLILASLIVWLMVLFAAGIIELLLCYFPLKIVRQNATLIIKQIFPIIILTHGIFWIAALLTIMLVYPTLNAAFKAITSIQFTFYSMTITPGAVLGIVFIGYATLLCSQGIRAFLCQEVLPRYNVDPGVQISIARLVHYAILTIGFFILLRVLGFGLSQITILGGALGIGIGFGLQAIVNNFVSGLILLFERPIKVGDMIEVGEELGEVKELGLRATTVQTFDNAEIVIPNSELITSSVTNWTLAEKRIRVKVPVGVAYGSDIEKVLKVLLSCAEANPTVLSTPKPQALFLAFGSSSLDFEVRVWIADFADRLEVLSELNQDIENEFQLAGIEIPFPQTDLHVRSVDDEIAALINNNSG
ncbi:MAG: mechanosensitive ion channel [Deltaproteobacteria bacterium]|nr:mechanosensitive ion channel [Deltaproteobacteria bacterium]